MTVSKDLLDALMKDYKNPEDLIGETGLLKQLAKQLLERAMQADMSEPFGYEKNATTDKKTNFLLSERNLLFVDCANMSRISPLTPPIAPKSAVSPFYLMP